MNIPLLIAAADALKHAEEFTPNTKERADIHSARKHVAGILACRGVFIGGLKPDNEDAQAILAARDNAVRHAVGVLLESADNTGCSEDLTVVSQKALTELAKAAGFQGMPRDPDQGQPDATEQSAPPLPLAEVRKIMQQPWHVSPESAPQPLSDAETLRALADPNKRDPVGELAVELVDAVRYEFNDKGGAAWDRQETFAAVEQIIRRYNASFNFKP